MLGYVQRWEEDDAKATALAIELDFAKDPIEIAPGIGIKGKVDLVREDQKGLWIVEHKTMKQIPTEDQRFFDLQTAVYTTAVEKIMGIKLSGVLWDYCRTKPPAIPELLKSGGLTRKVKIDTDYNTFYQEIVENGLNPKDYLVELERTKSNVYYERKYMPKSPRMIEAFIREFATTAYEIEHLQHHPTRNMGKFSCSDCEYRNLCEAELMDLDTSFMLKTDFIMEGGENNSSHAEETNVNTDEDNDL